MALQLPYNIQVLNPYPLDYYYYNDDAPYTNVAEVNSTIPSAVRYKGLTVNVDNVEYWYKDGVTDSDLEEKIPEVVLAHTDLTGLTTGDDHTQYALLAGRSGDALSIDNITEYTTAAGVTIDGVIIKDSEIDWSYISNTPTTLVNYGITDTDLTDMSNYDTDDLDEGSTNLYFTTSRVDTEIDSYVDKAFIDALNVNADTLDGHDTSYFLLASQRGATNGVASLDASGQVPSSQLPSITIGNVDVVADNTARDALSAVEGDVAVVTGTSKTWIYDGSTWIEITTTSAVDSVNGYTGTVSLDTDDITEGSSNLYYTEARVNANTNVSANTSARHNAVTIGTANGLSLSTQELSLQLASSSTTGALSSTDWVKFNNGASLTDLTDTYIPYYDSTEGELQDSNISTDGTTVTVDGKLVVDDGKGNSIFIGEGSGTNDDGTDNYNVGVGVNALYGNGGTLTGTNNVAIGNEAIYSGQSVQSCVAIGNGALYSATSLTGIVAIGVASLRNVTSGNYNTAIGYHSLYDVTTGQRNVAIGHEAAPSLTTSNYNIAIGYKSLFENETGTCNVAIGDQALYSSTNCDNVIAIGYNTLSANTTGDNNIGVGYRSLYYNTTGQRNLAIGYNALYYNTTSSDNIAIGDNALYTNTGSINTAIGYYSLNKNTTGTSNIGVGYYTLLNNTTGSYNVAFGREALRYNTTGLNNVSVGHFSLFNNISGHYNVSVGRSALYSVETISYLTAVGYQALQANTTGAYNSAFGANSLLSNTEGHYNTAIGRDALYSSTTSNHNTALGYRALYSIEASSDHNVAIGGNSMFSVTTSTANVAVGYGSLYYASGSSYNVAIGYSSIGNTATVTTGDYNIAIGSHSLYNLSTGTGNMTFGNRSLYSLTSGSNNIAIGQYTLEDNTTANNNIAVGYNSLNTNTTGTTNIGIGYYSLNKNTTGNYNIAIGNEALMDNTTSISNIAIGPNALHENTTSHGNIVLGYSSLYHSTNGAYNVVIGYTAAYNVTDSGSNVIIGLEAGYHDSNSDNLTDITNSILLGAQTKPSDDAETNQIVIGYQAEGIGSNTVVLGNDSIVTTALKGDVGINTTAPAAELDVNGYCIIRGTGTGATISSPGTLAIKEDDGVSSISFHKIDGSLGGTITADADGGDFDLTGFSSYTINNDTTIDGELLITGLQGTGIRMVTVGADGTLSYDDLPEGSGNITGTGTANQIAYFSDTSEITGSSAITWDGTTFDLVGDADLKGVLKVYDESDTSKYVKIDGNGQLDTNGNIYYYDSDFYYNAGDLRLGANRAGAGIFYDGSADRVGINTDTPDVTLDVDGAAYFKGTARVYDSSTSNSYLVFNGTGSGDGNGSIYYYYSSGANNYGDLRLGSNTSSTGIYIDTSAQKVGFNDDGPNYTVDINGEARATDFILNSDPKLKNVTGLAESGLDIVRKLKPITFKWKDDRDEHEHIGFLTTDVKQIRPELVKTEGEYEALSYVNITSINTSAIKGLDRKVDDINEELKDKIKQLEKRIEELENGSTSR